jgi:hypothetical protein
LACRTLRLGKIIAEARSRRDAEEYGDAATIGNRPSALLRLHVSALNFPFQQWIAVDIRGHPANRAATAEAVPFTHPSPTNRGLVLATCLTNSFRSVLVSVDSRFPTQGQPLPGRSATTDWAERLTCHQRTNGSRAGRPVVTPPGARAKVALDFEVVSLACRTLGLGKIIAEARRRRDAEEYGDTATIGNHPSAPPRLRVEFVF